MIWVPWVLSGMGVFLALISLLRTFLVAGRDQSTKFHDDLGHVHERLSLVEMKMGVFWRLVEENLSGMLKKPTHLEMDNLLDKLKDHSITLQECRILRRWLQEVYLTQETVRAQERIIAILVMAAVESLIHEKERA